MNIQGEKLHKVIHRLEYVANLLNAVNSPDAVIHMTADDILDVTDCSVMLTFEEEGHTETAILLSDKSKVMN